MTFVVVAVWTAREGSEAAVETALTKMIEPTRAEPGCVTYRIQRRLDDPRVFLLYEEYREKGDYESHLASDHFARYANEEGIPLLESRERSFFEPIG